MNKVQMSFVGYCKWGRGKNVSVNDIIGVCCHPSCNTGILLLRKGWCAAVGTLREEKANGRNKNIRNSQEDREGRGGGKYEIKCVERKS